MFRWPHTLAEVPLEDVVEPPREPFVVEIDAARGEVLVIERRVPTLYFLREAKVGVAWTKVSLRAGSEPDAFLVKAAEVMAVARDVERADEVAELSLRAAHAV